MPDLSKFTTSDLQAMLARDLSRVSTGGLKMLAEEVGSAGAPTPPGQIPGQAPDVRAPPATGDRTSWGPPDVVSKALEGAMGIPVMGIGAGLAKGGLAGSKYLPYAERAAEALIPRSLPEMLKWATMAGLGGAGGEIARHDAEAGGAGPVGQSVAEAAGAVLPLGAYGAGRLATDAGRKVVSQVRAAGGKPMNAALSALREDVTAAAGGGLKSAEASQESAQQRVSRIGSAQEQLGGRETVAQARVRERTGKVQKALDSIAPAKGVLLEDVGSVIQSQGKANVEQMAGTRQQKAVDELKRPAMEAAVAREAKGDFIATNPRSRAKFDEALEDLETQIEGTTEPHRTQLKTRLRALRGEEVEPTAGDTRAATVREALTGEKTLPTTKPITLQQAEFMRRLLTDYDMAKESGFSALDAARRGDVAKKLREAMIAYEPRIGAYLEKYRTLSAPIAKATAGRGAALTEADLLAGDEALFASDKGAAARYFLDGSSERAERLLALTGGKNPALMDSVRGYLRSSMEGMTGEQMKTMIGKNAGALRVFPELRAPLENAAQAQSRLEGLAKAAERRASAAQTRLAGAKAAPERAAAAATKQAEDYRRWIIELDTARPEAVPARARSVARSMRKDGIINDFQYRQLSSQISDAESKIAGRREAASTISYAVRKALLYSGIATAVGLPGYVTYKATGGLHGP